MQNTIVFAETNSIAKKKPFFQLDVKRVLMSFIAGSDVWQCREFSRNISALDRAGASRIWTLEVP
jgi:hypothetical protein